MTDSCSVPIGIANVYPNPANNQVTVQLASNTVFLVQFTLLNANGVQVFTVSLTTAATLVTVSASRLARKLYHKVWLRPADHFRNYFDYTLIDIQYR